LLFILSRIIDRSGLLMVIITLLALASFIFVVVCLVRNDRTHWYLALDMLYHSIVLWFGGFKGVLLCLGFAPRTWKFFGSD
jgi:hypothetical protein